MGLWQIYLYAQKSFYVPNFKGQKQYSTCLTVWLKTLAARYDSQGNHLGITNEL